MTAAGARPHDGKGKAPPSAGRRWLVGLGYFAISSPPPAGASKRNTKHFSPLSAITILAHRGPSVSRRDDDLSIRLSRVRDRGRNSRRPDTFIGEVMRAAKKAGHVGESFGRGTGGAHRSRFGRGRGAALSLSLRSGSRRVVTKARVVRHTGSRFRSAPLANHVIYLKRHGGTHDASRNSVRPGKGRSRPSAGRASTGHSVMRPTRAPASPTFGLALQVKTRRCGG